MVTAIFSRGSSGRRRLTPRVALPAGLAGVLTTAVVVAGCQSAAAPRPQSVPVPRVPGIVARPAPAGWHLASLPNGTAVLAYPPVMQPIAGDKGEVSAARISSSGAYLLYLNSTPKQDAETLSGWPAFRVEHQRQEDSSAVRMLAASYGVQFLGGTGTCVIDSYVTHVHANHFTEIACFVRGRTGASVIVAAAPTADWASASGLLLRAVAAYRVR